MVLEISKIYTDLMADLDRIDLVDGPLDRAALAGKATYDRLREISIFMSSYRFSSVEEEIEFFKTDLPSVLAKYFYWSKVLDLEVRKKGKNPEMLSSLLSDERKGMTRFYSNSRSFLKYYLEHLTFIDDLLFRRHFQSFWPFDPFTPLLDANFPRASEIIGAYLAYENYIIFLNEQEKSLLNEDTDSEGRHQIELLLSDADLVELIAPVHALKLVRIDGKAPTQAELLDIVDKYLNRKIKDNFSAIDNKNRARKKGLTPFLQQLIDASNARSNRLLK